MTTIAAASVGAVGTYAWLHATNYGGSSVGAGGTLAGSNLRYAGFTSIHSGTINIANAAADTNQLKLVANGGTPAGTWRAMGRAYGANGTSYDPSFNAITLWLRIS
jgi:hypothetical protein